MRVKLPSLTSGSERVPRRGEGEYEGERKNKLYNCITVDTLSEVHIK